MRLMCLRVIVYTAETPDQREKIIEIAIFVDIGARRAGRLAGGSSVESRRY